MQVEVERVPVSAIEGHELPSFDWCNTNNHEDTGRQVSNKEYEERTSRTSMSQWLPALGHLCRYQGSTLEVVVPASVLSAFFKPASEFARSGTAVHRVLGEEFEECAVQVSQLLEDGAGKVPEAGWFVRTAHCSPKDAEQEGGFGPHHSLKAVLMAVAASDRCQKALRVASYQEDLTLYLSPFDPEVSTSRELRVFVSNWEVTAISQYAWTNPSSHFSDMADDELVKVGFLVDQFNRGQVSSAWRRAGGIDCYVMDVEVVFEKTGHSVVRLIELNTFGAEFSSGSALYHWLRDDHILQGRTQGEDLRANDAINSLPVLRKVYFRVLCSESSKLLC